MNKNKLATMIAGTTLAAFSAACGDTAVNTNTATANTAASNVAVVVNSNSNTPVIGTTNANVRNYNANITRADYDRDRDRYAAEAKEAGSTIGQGAEDGWLWTKTRSSLLATDDLRESTINVDVNNNVVTLKGTVANAAQKSKAVQVAKAIDGVKSVRDELKISAGDSIVNTNSGNANRNAAVTNANRRN